MKSFMFRMKNMQNIVFNFTKPIDKRLSMNLTKMFMNIFQVLKEE